MLIEEVVTIPEICQGWKVSKSWVYGKIADGKLPAVTLPGAVYCGSESRTSRHCSRRRLRVTVANAVATKKNAQPWEAEHPLSSATSDRQHQKQNVTIVIAMVTQCSG